MTGYCTLVLYLHLPAARESTAAHSCNIPAAILPSYLSHSIHIYHVCILALLILLLIIICCFGPPLPIHLGPPNTKLVPTPL